MYVLFIDVNILTVFLLEKKIVNKYKANGTQLSTEWPWLCFHYPVDCTKQLAICIDLNNLDRNMSFMVEILRYSYESTIFSLDNKD
jgi:hypothetical protein